MYIIFFQIQFDEQGNLIRWGGRPILLNATVPRDDEVLRLLEKFRPAIVDLVESKIGSTLVHLDGDSCRRAECNIGNMITDAHIYTRLNQYNGTYWTDAAIALLQSGGIRSSISPVNISKFDLKTALPYKNELFVVNATGALLVQVLEHAVGHYTGDRGEFMQMSGMHVKYDMSKASGQRVQSVEVLCTQCDIPSYSSIDANEEYGVIISDFLYDGGDGYTMFKVSFLVFSITEINDNFIMPGNVLDNFKLKSEMIFAARLNFDYIFQGLKIQRMHIIEFDSALNYIQDMGKIYPAVENRITMLNLNQPHRPISASASHFVVFESIIVFTFIVLLFM